MSRCYYLKSENFINLEAVQETVQKLMNEGFTVKLEEFEPSEGEGGCFYIEGEAARGIQVFYEDDSIVVKINTLCNYADYIMAKIILDILGNALEKEIIDEEDNVIVADEYFTDEQIQELREGDAKTVLVALKNIVKDNMQIFGVVRKIYFGQEITQELVKYEDNPKTLVKVFDSIIHHVQYELPDYNMPGAALIRPKDSEDEKDFLKIRMMFEGNPYILQDYDYLMVRPDEKSEEVIFIDNDDLLEIVPQIFKKNSEFEFADDFTIVFPKLEGKAWNHFIELAREKNHKELLDAQGAAKTVNLTPDANAPKAQTSIASTHANDAEAAYYDSESEEEDDYQYHGNHWDCILEDAKNEINQAIADSIEKAKPYGDTTCDYNLDEKLHGKVAMLEFDNGDNDSPIVVRSVVATTKDNKLTLVSGYPVVKDGILLPLKITEIKEWDNGLEGWITAELSDGRGLTFFDVDYAINKEKYEIGQSYDFILGALAYYATEPESKGFKFEGQQAIDFKAKMGEEPEYDEDGNVKPVEFSTASLCAFLQAGHAPDEVEYISTVEEVKSVKAMGKNYWNFNVIYRSEEDESEEIPTFVLKSPDNAEIQKADQLQGILWLTGYLAR